MPDCPRGRHDIAMGDHTHALTDPAAPVP
jgi:hypothetical protein